MLTNNYLADDLNAGIVLRILRTAVLDGIPGWAVVAMHDGEVWAYAPQNYMLTYGEIARQI